MSNLADPLLAFNTDYLPETVAVKYGKMQENVFRFFRDTCLRFDKGLHQGVGLD